MTLHEARIWKDITREAYERAQSDAKASPSQQANDRLYQARREYLGAREVETLAYLAASGQFSDEELSESEWNRQKGMYWDQWKAGLLEKKAKESSSSGSR